MRQLVFVCMMWAGAALAGYAQTSTDPPAKLSRKERRELARLAGQKVALPPLRTLSDRDREQAEALFVEGVKYVLLEDYAKALERLGKAYVLAPDNAAVNYKIAEANLLSGNVAEATTYGEAAVRLDARNPYYYLLLAQLQASQKNYDAATRTYATLVKEVPQASNYLFNLADLYLAQNKLPEALATLEQAEKKFGQVDEVQFKKQQIYLKQNRLDLALAEGEKLMQANPSEARYVLAQAQLYAANNRPDEAAREARRALSLEPDSAPAHLLLADLYRQQRNPAAAAAEVKLAFNSPGLDIDEKVRILVGYIKQLPDAAAGQTALELAATTVRVHPKEAKAFAVAGDIQTLTEHKREARDTYLQALRLDNSKFQIWQQVVLIDAELGQNDSLLVHTDRALELFPNQASLWFYNGVAHSLKKQPQAAVRALEHGRRLVADNTELLAQFDAQLGDAYHELKQYDKSDAAYEAALKAEPANAQVLNNYSYYLAVRGEKLDQARRMAETVVRKFPENDTYLDTYAWVLYQQKDYAGARLQLEKALKTTQDATVMEHYGDVLYQLGQKEQAVAEWQRARKAGPASPLLDRKLKDRKLYE